MAAQPAVVSSEARIALLEGADALRAIERMMSAEISLRPSNVFHSPAIMRAAVKAAQSENIRVLAACIGQRNKCDTIWPLRIMRDMGIAIATDLADPLSQYSDVIGEPLDAAMLGELSSLLARDHSVDVLLARRVRSDSGLHGALAASDAAIISSTEAPFVDFARYPDFPAYTASFSKSTLRRTRQHAAKFEAEHGALSFEVHSGTNARQAIVTATEWKKNWLKSQYLLSRVFDDGPNELALAESCASPDCHVSILSAGGKAIAIEIGFSGGAHYASYLGAYDPSFAAYGVGKLQALRTIEWCFEAGFSRYDLLPPDGEYKQHWARHHAGEPVRDCGLALSRPGQMYLFVRRHARTSVQRTVESIPPSMRGAAKRYGPAALSAGAAAAAIAMMND